MQLYPDMGVAAMLKNQWSDARFIIDCLNDRKPYEEDDEVLIMAAPDPLGAEDCRRIASEVKDQTPLVLFNPRLARYLSFFLLFPMGGFWSLGSKRW